MHVQVEYCAGHRGEQTPQRIGLDGRFVEVVEILDQWQGTDYRYFKLRGDDQNLYILRLDETGAQWELTLFQTPRGAVISEQSAAQPPGRKQPAKPH